MPELEVDALLAVFLEQRLDLCEIFGGSLVIAGRDLFYHRVAAVMPVHFISLFLDVFEYVCKLILRVLLAFRDAQIDRGFQALHTYLVER